MGVGHLGLPMMGMVLVDPAGPVDLVAQGGLEVLVGPAGQVDRVAQDGLEVLVGLVVQGDSTGLEVVEVDRRRRRLHRQEATTPFMEPTEQPILGWRLIQH
jgi:hypothetical protein